MENDSKILIPVDLGCKRQNEHLNTVAMLTMRATGFVHLLYVTNEKDTAIFPGYLMDAAIEKLQQENSHVRFSGIVSSGDVQTEIVRYANKLKASLVILAKNRYHRFAPFLNTIQPRRIVRAVECPVLIINNTATPAETTTIIVAVTRMPLRAELDVLERVMHVRPGSIHLVTVLSRNEQPDNVIASAVLGSMRRIRERLQCEVKHAIIHANKKREALVQYAAAQRGSLLVLDPAESELPQNTGPVKVLAIQSGYQL